MSTARNHAKRSHRSNYRARMYNGSRKSVIKPTVSKNAFMRFIGAIRNAMRRSEETKGDIK